MLNTIFNTVEIVQTSPTVSSTTYVYTGSARYSEYVMNVSVDYDSHYDSVDLSFGHSGANGTFPGTATGTVSSTYALNCGDSLVNGVTFDRNIMANTENILYVNLTAEDQTTITVFKFTLTVLAAETSSSISSWTSNWRGDTGLGKYSLLSHRVDHSSILCMKVL